MKLPRFAVRASLLLVVGALVLAGGLCRPGPALATKYAGAFMENGGGARALAMGGAFTAVAADPSAVFWNPAGLATVRNFEVLLMHAERFGDIIDRDFVAATFPVSWNLLGGESSGFGLSAIRLGIEDIPFTDHLTDQLDVNDDGVVDDWELLGNDNPENPAQNGVGIFALRDQIEYHTDQELAFFASYGERLGFWRVGGTLKVIRQSIGEYSSLGIGADLAVFRPGIWRRLDVALKLQDITTTYLSWSTGHNEIIYPAVVPAAAYYFPLPAWRAGVRLATSFETRFENRRAADQYWSGSWSTNVHVGAEIDFNDRVFVRGGFDSGWEDKDMTAGVGFRVDRLTVDYAYAGDSLKIDEVTHRISLTARF